MATSVCLVGRRHLFRAGLSHLLDPAQFVIAAAIDDLNEASTRGRSATLFLVDKPEDVGDLEDEVRLVKQTDASNRVVVLAPHLDQQQMVLGFAMGVDGYLLETISPVALNESLRLVMVGETVFPSQLATLLCQQAFGLRAGRVTLSRDAALSAREAEIILRLADGMPNKVIASELTITEATVKVHLKSILKKLGVTNRTQAAVWAISNGLVERTLEPGSDQVGPSMYAIATH